MMDENFSKIISATYKLMELLPDGDPLKNKAKERTLLIMEKLSARVPDATLADDIAVLENYLELAKGQGWIHGINFLIVKREWESVRQELEVTSVPRGSETRAPLQGARPGTQDLGAPGFGGDIRPKQTTSEDYSERQHKILKILARKEKVQVQDIIKEMPDVTKRTIRRDLDDLLKMGKVARMGEFNQVFYHKADGRLIGDQPERLGHDETHLLS